VIQLTPIFNLFNSFLPPVAVFLVISAVISSLPARSGDPANRELKHATATAPKLKAAAYHGMKRRQIVPNGTKTYTIPTSMRSRPQRFY
jgi:hypothetical protein